MGTVINQSTLLNKSFSKLLRKNWVEVDSALELSADLQCKIETLFVERIGYGYSILEVENYSKCYHIGLCQ